MKARKYVCLRINLKLVKLKTVAFHERTGSSKLERRWPNNQRNSYREIFIWTMIKYSSWYLWSGGAQWDASELLQYCLLVAMFRHNQKTYCTPAPTSAKIKQSLSWDQLFFSMTIIRYSFTRLDIQVIGSIAIDC